MNSFDQQPQMPPQGDAPQQVSPPAAPVQPGAQGGTPQGNPQGVLPQGAPIQGVPAQGAQTPMPTVAASAAPAQQPPVQAGPAQANPVQATPQGVPVQGVSVQGNPVQGAAEPNAPQGAWPQGAAPQASPVQVNPVQTVPQGVPVQNAGVNNTPCNFNGQQPVQNNTQSNFYGNPAQPGVPNAQYNPYYIQYAQYNQYNPYYGQYPLYPGVYQMPQLYYEKQAVAKTGTKVGGALLLFYLFVNCLQVLIIVGLNLLYQQTQNMAFSLNLLLAEPIFSLLLNTVLTFVGFGGAALCLIKMQRRRVRELISFAKPNKALFWPMVFTAIGGCYIANIGVSILQQRLSPVFELKSQDFGTPQGILGFVISFLTTACAPALIEEFFFRGAILGSLRKFGDSFAIFTSAILFGLVHGNLIQIPFAFTVGLLLGFAVVKTGSIWTGVLIHFLNNFLAVLQEHGSLYLNENLMQLLNYVLVLVLIIGGIFAAYRLTVKSPNIFAFAKTPHVSTAGQRFGWFMGRPTVIIFIIITALTVLTVQLQ